MERGDAATRFDTDGDSWWLDEALDAEGRPAPSEPLAGEETADVVVVGAGYTGLWTAIQLKERDPALEVTVLEATTVGRSPSGMNGGFMSGYRAYQAAFTRAIGADGARAVVEMGEIAQHSIIEFLGSDAASVWLSREPTCLVATSGRQVELLRRRVRDARASGAIEVPALLEGDELRRRFALTTFRGMLMSGNSATVHPARLLRLLRRRAVEAGIRLHEDSAVTSIDGTGPHVVATSAGRVRCRAVVLATNYRGTGAREGRSHLTTLSSYALVSAPMPELLERTGWGLGRGGRDARMFLNWFRSTPDGRMVFGSAVGPIARGAHAGPAIAHHATFRRVIRDYRAVFPEFQDVPVERAWAGPIDMASDQFPFVGRRPRSSIYYGYGLSGHGVNAAWIVGACLASLVSGADDRWSRSPIVTRKPAWLPPEPARYIGGTIIKRSIVRVEDALDSGREPKLIDRAISEVPRVLNLRVGIRD